MKKIISFVGICLYLLGLIGGVGYCAMNKAYVIVVGVVGLAVMAWPQLKKCYNELVS